MEKEPQSEFEEVDRRIIQWQRLGQTAIGLYRHLEDDTMHVLVQNNHPTEGEDYWVTPCAGHRVYDVFRNPWDHR